MDDSQTRLREVRDRIAHLQQLLADRVAAGEAARALLAQEPTPPRRCQVIEAELLEVAADVAWIQADLKPLMGRERLLEAALGDEMARDLELAATAAARAAKTPKPRGRRPKSAQPTATEVNRGDAG